MFKLLTSDQWNKENHLRRTPGKRILRHRPQCGLVSFPRRCRNEDANQMCTLQKMWHWLHRFARRLSSNSSWCRERSGGRFAFGIVQTVVNIHFILKWETVDISMFTNQRHEHPATNAIVALTDNYARINHRKV